MSGNVCVAQLAPFCYLLLLLLSSILEALASRQGSLNTYAYIGYLRSSYIVKGASTYPDADALDPLCLGSLFNTDSRDLNGETGNS
ncbi:hypothetical protein N7532_002314 [Penicillium argentinense]|uniref:Uncharacterized protein n=1 Tax=Penicillium argentinense TaxID=1131581 RepID=A0A9W9G070_9EURO|nr:uncharacterized protein N7532_002314 [Penicillium argentinense]KAJ5109669.1 hypothetical protein N7532_002314 [Penicillium argentinense]